MKTLGGVDYKNIEQFQELAKESMDLDIVSHGGNKNAGTETNHGNISGFVQGNIAELNKNLMQIVGSALKEWDS